MEMESEPITKVKAGGLTEDEKIDFMRPSPTQTATLAHIELLHAMLRAKTAADFRNAEWAEVFESTMERLGYIALRGTSDARIKALRNMEATQRIACAWGIDPRSNPQLDDDPLQPVLWTKHDRLGEAQMICNAHECRFESEAAARG